MTDADLIASFLYREARLMDESRYDEWEALWADDGIYWVPCGAETDPNRDVSLIYADRQEISSRVARLNTGNAYSQQPVSKMCRVVSNIEIEPQGQDEWVTWSVFNLTELRRRNQKVTQNIWAGRTMHRLRLENGELKIRFKKVVLVNSEEPIPTLSFLI